MESELIDVLEAVEKDPHRVLIYRYLKLWEEAIQEDLGDIHIHEVERVLFSFSRAILKVYEEHLKSILFPNQEHAIANLLFQGLIHKRLEEIIKDIVRTDFQKMLESKQHSDKHSEPPESEDRQTNTSESSTSTISANRTFYPRANSRKHALKQYNPMFI